MVDAGVGGCDGARVYVCVCVCVCVTLTEDHTRNSGLIEDRMQVI